VVDATSRSEPAVLIDWAAGTAGGRVEAGCEVPPHAAKPNVPATLRAIREMSDRFGVMLTSTLTAGPLVPGRLELYGYLDLTVRGSDNYGLPFRAI
jgi:hypothetical protein